MKTVVPFNTIIHDHVNYPPGVPASVEDDVAAEWLAADKCRLPVVEVAAEADSVVAPRGKVAPKGKFKTAGKDDEV